MGKRGLHEALLLMCLLLVGIVVLLHAHSCKACRILAIPTIRNYSEPIRSESSVLLHTLLLFVVVCHLGCILMQPLAIRHASTFLPSRSTSPGIRVFRIL